MNEEDIQETANDLAIIFGNALSVAMFSNKGTDLRLSFDLFAAEAVPILRKFAERARR